MNYNEGIAVLASRTRVVTIALRAFIVLGVVSTASEFAEAAGILNAETGEDSLSLTVALVYLAYAVALIASVIFVGMWIHRAHANLRAAGIEGLEFTPGWAVGWYFIPFANLIKPYGAMRELWNASHGETDNFASPASNHLNVWWFAWIVGNIASNIGQRIATSRAESYSAGMLLSAIGSALLVAAGIVLLRLVREINTAQRDGLSAAATFA